MTIRHPMNLVGLAVEGLGDREWTVAGEHGMTVREGVGGIVRHRFASITACPSNRHHKTVARPSPDPRANRPPDPPRPSQPLATNHWWQVECVFAFAGWPLSPRLVTLPLNSCDTPSATRHRPP
jgi:hypothetical protein